MRIEGGQRNDGGEASLVPRNECTVRLIGTVCHAKRLLLLNGTVKIGGILAGNTFSRVQDKYYVQNILAPLIFLNITVLLLTQLSHPLIRVSG